MSDENVLSPFAFFLVLLRRHLLLCCYSSISRLSSYAYVSVNCSRVSHHVFPFLFILFLLLDAFLQNCCRLFFAPLLLKGRDCLFFILILLTIAFMIVMTFLLIHSSTHIPLENNASLFLSVPRESFTPLNDPIALFSYHRYVQVFFNTSIF